MLRTALVVSLFCARLAHANCDYEGTFSTGWSATCPAETSVPLGCPIHVVTEHGAAEPVAHLYRGQAEVATTSAATLDGAATQPVSTIDIYDCACPHESHDEAVDHYTVTFTNAQPGDVIAFANNNLIAGIADVGPAGPCPTTTTWPIITFQLPACDLCPMDPTDPPHDPTNPHADAACSASGAAGLAPAWLVAVALVASRRRKRS